jgi:hypothetical protein
MPKSPKSTIAGLLFKLGHDVRTMGGDQADELVLKLTRLDMTTENYEEIIVRLTVLLDEKQHETNNSA